MEVLPVAPETWTSSPAAARTLPSSSGPSQSTTSEALPPCWERLPAERRRRLVAVLGTLVQRTRAEVSDEQ